MQQNSNKINNLSWVILISTAIMLIFAVDFLMQARTVERLILSQQSENLEHINKFYRSIESLSDKATSYVVRLNENIITNYLDEIDSKKIRERSIEKLNNIGASREESKKLSEALIISDKLVAKQKLSIILSKPNNQKFNISNVTIPENYQDFAHAKRVEIAKDILFSEEYDNIKMEFYVKMLEYHQEMTKRMTMQTIAASERSNILMLMVIILSTLIVAVAIALVWKKVFKK